MPRIDAVAKHIKHIGVGDMNIDDGSTSLGAVYARHGRYNDSLEWYDRALTGYENALGVGHPTALTTIHSMASVFYDQGEYGKVLE